MELLQSWKESLAIFLPKNLKLFLLVTFNTFLQTWTVILRNFWWLFILYIVSSIIIDLIDPRYIFSDKKWLYWYLRYFVPWFYLLWGAVITTIMTVITKLSAQKKNVTYFWSHKVVFLFALFFIIIALSIGSVVVEKLHYFLFDREINPVAWIKGAISCILLPFLPLQQGITNVRPDNFSFIFCSPLLIMFILFLYDSRSTIRDTLLSIKRAFVCVLYNYPFFLSVLLIHTTISLMCINVLFVPLFLMSGVGEQPSTLSVVMYDVVFYMFIAIAALFYFCILTTFYSKQLSEKPQLYR